MGRAQECALCSSQCTIDSLMLASRETLVVQNYGLLLLDELAEVRSVKEVDLLCADLSIW